MSGAKEILSSLGTALGTAFPTYTVVYNAPIDGTYTGAGKWLKVHMMEEDASLQSQNVLGGKELVSPILSVSISQPITGADTPESLTRAGDLWDLAGSLRAAIFAWIIGTRSAPITGGITLSFTRFSTIPATLDLGATSGTETVTVQAYVTYTRNAGAA